MQSAEAMRKVPCSVDGIECRRLGYDLFYAGKSCAGRRDHSPAPLGEDKLRAAAHQDLVSGSLTQAPQHETDIGLGLVEQLRSPGDTAFLQQRQQHAKLLCIDLSEIHHLVRSKGR